MGSGYVLGVDCGTSAVKAAVWSPCGELIGFGRAPLRILHPGGVFYEQDAGSWVGGIAAAVRRALEDARSRHTVLPESIKAVCVCHQRETFVPVGPAAPLRNAILWMDERAAGLCSDITALICADRFRDITGKTLSGNLSLVKIEWLKRHEPGIFARTRMYLDVHAYVMKALTGRAVTGFGSADPTGLFDMAARDWSQEILNALGIGPDQLPETEAPGTVCGTLTPKAAGALGLSRGIPVVIGLGDGQSAGLGAGITGPGESYLSLGTSVVSGTCCDRYITGKECRTSFGGVPDSWYLETVILGGAFTVDWFLDRFRPRGGEAGMREQAALLPCGSEGLILVPYFNSAMNPYWDSQARGITVGWSPAHGPAHFYRAVLEGIAFEQRLHTEGVQDLLLQNGYPGIQQYVVSGGGADNQVWLQIIADVTGRRVQPSAVREAGALGAGILAAAAAGIHPDVPAAVRAMSRRGETVFEPRAECKERYNELYLNVYKGLYPACADALRNLHAEVHPE
ncbi:MAG: hypothetical protein JXB03_03015 [Spirochaetales bacterium]|nr:hypothetical protein [Spirochaetales bacterium]